MLKKYWLSKSMADRVNYDDAVRKFIEELELSPETSFEAFWEVAKENFDTDDVEEARARALSVWRRMRGTEKQTPVQLLQVAENPVVYVANAIAITLGHGCAIPREQAANLPSLNALKHAWALEAALYNDRLAPDEGWQACIRRWWYPENHPTEPKALLETGLGKVQMAWSTPSRLEVTVFKHNLSLVFSSADEPNFLEVRVSFKNGENGWALDVYASGDNIPQMYGNRPKQAARIRELCLPPRTDRLHILWRLDEDLDGAIVEDVKDKARILDTESGALYTALLECHAAWRD